VTVFFFFFHAATYLIGFGNGGRRLVCLPQIWPPFAFSFPLCQERDSAAFFGQYQEAFVCSLLSFFLFAIFPLSLLRFPGEVGVH